MPESGLLQLAGIVVLGVAAQWLAWRVGLPSILLLLTGGLIAGPVTGWLDPNALFGELLSPFVSLSVALILFEGGLTLKLSELPKIGGVVRNLVTIGAAITWLITAAAAHYILGLNIALSVLLAAILVVTGPTVIGPMLRHIRPTGVVGPALRWEGIIIDPIGALLTVLIFEVLVIGEAKEASLHIVVALLKTIFVGGGLGLLAAGLMILLLKRYWVADHLQSAFAVMLVMASFVFSDTVQHESGLLAVTVMGFVLANQKQVEVEQIIEFKENLQVLLLSILFIVLAARLDPHILSNFGLREVGFVVVLIVVARPAAVFVSTMGKSLDFGQRVFLCWMAPRGIVAAAVASVFAIRLEAQGMAGAEVLVPITFLTIITTVAVYGLTAPILAQRLGVAESNPQGVLFVGAQAWVRDMAIVLQREGFLVLLVDANRENIRAARMAGLPTFHGSILAEHVLDKIELGGLGKLIATTPNDWVNILTVRRFARIFGKVNCFQVMARQSDNRDERHRYLRGRRLWSQDVSHAGMASRMASSHEVKATKISEQFDYAAYQKQYGAEAIPLFVIQVGKKLEPVTADEPVVPQPDCVLIGLVREEEEKHGDGQT